MLGDYIEKLKDSIKSGDQKKIDKIFKDLSKLGMDKASALIIVKEQYSNDAEVVRKVNDIASSRLLKALKL